MIFTFSPDKIISLRLTAPLIQFKPNSITVSVSGSFFNSIKMLFRETQFKNWFLPIKIFFAFIIDKLESFEHPLKQSSAIVIQLPLKRTTSDEVFRKS